MSSRDGLGRADVDVGLYSDPKVGKLLRRQNDPERTVLTMFLYTATILASWKAAEPVTLDDAMPLWCGRIATHNALVADLVAVGLLDESGCIPSETLDKWMTPSRLRSDRAQDAANARWRKSGRNAAAMPIASQPASRVRPRAAPREEPTNGKVAPERLKDILKQAGGFASTLVEPEASS